MSAVVYKKVDYPLNKLIQDIDFGDIGLPDIQRPFVWKATRVRDLFDSMYKGFPVGYLLFWSNDQFEGTKPIGTGEHQHKIPHLLIVDGQQRLTSLYAVLKGKPVMNKEYKEDRIRIAFNPITERFEVTDAAIRKDPEWIPDISAIWVEGAASYKAIQRYLGKLRESRTVDDRTEDRIGHSIDRLFDLQSYPFTALEISSGVDEEQVADIFVRINSQGMKLNQGDFILTLLSVFWDEGREALETFSRKARVAPGRDVGPSPYNHHIEPEPDQLLRVAIGYGFKRGRLKSVYQVLRAKDPDTGEVNLDQRERMFGILKEAQAAVLDLTNWHEFLKALISVGYKNGKMVTSENSLLFTYIFYLIGKKEFRIEPKTLRRLIGRFFFMNALTSKYSTSPETTLEKDLVRLRDVSDAEGFRLFIERTIEESLTSDFWEVNLPNLLETSSAASPAFNAFQAAQCILDAPALFSTIKIDELMDPTIQTTRSHLERHHLFPKAYLASQGIKETRMINQVANYAMIEWGDNAKISDQSPWQYIPKLSGGFIADEFKRMCRLNALPTEWYEMGYEDFLGQRRRLISQVIRQGFESLVSPREQATIGTVLLDGT